MKRVTALLITAALVILPAKVLASAFEDHSSWQKEPWLETEKGISVGKSVLEMGMGFRFIQHRGKDRRRDLLGGHFRGPERP